MKKLLSILLIALSVGFAWPAYAAQKTQAQVAASINPSVYHFGEKRGGYCTATKIGPREYLTARHCAERLSTDYRLYGPKNELVFVRSVLVSTGEKSRANGRYRREDWAILVASVPSKAPSLTLGCGEKPYLGMPVAYIGFPEAIERMFGMGYVAGTTPAPTNHADFFIDVPVAPGASAS
jgi:hypothetical protein